MKGGAEKDRQRGTLLHYLASLAQPNDNSVAVIFPKQFQLLNLRPLDLYGIVLDFARAHWPDLSIVSETGARQPGLLFKSSGIKSYSTVCVRGIKYGAYTLHRGKAYAHAYIRGRDACRIEYILSLSIPQPSGDPLVQSVAIVRPFVTDNKIPVTPWQEWETDLGIRVWYYNRFEPLAVVPLETITGQFAYSKIRIPRCGMFWVTFSLDNSTQEPDNVDED
ncbi:hypothetical protein PLICRDRAFT_26330 [Plicaturopsis crispa FD-325 SS-3]|nr:hypothetical protein PLICRDRAFT_26330 [Plicaturopsis crispa FD-325 SS-3]